MKHEYSIPDDIRKLITREFLENLRDELYKANNLALSDFYMDTLFHFENTQGFDVAFGLVCINSNIDNLYVYSESLPWDDGDLFYSSVCDMMIENHLVLPGFASDYLAEQLKLKKDEFVDCCECGKHFLRKLLIEEKHGDTNYIQYICNKCENKRRGEDSGHNEYYLNGMKILNERFRKESSS